MFCDFAEKKYFMQKGKHKNEIKPDAPKYSIDSIKTWTDRLKYPNLPPEI